MKMLHRIIDFVCHLQVWLCLHNFQHVRYGTPFPLCALLVDMLLIVLYAVVALCPPESLILESEARTMLKKKQTYSTTHFKSSLNLNT